MTVQIIAQAESHTDYLIAGHTKKGIKTHFHGTKKAGVTTIINPAQYMIV